MLKKPTWSVARPGPEGLGLVLVVGRVEPLLVPPSEPLAGGDTLGSVDAVGVSEVVRVGCEVGVGERVGVGLGVEVGVGDGDGVDGLQPAEPTKSG